MAKQAKNNESNIVVEDPNDTVKLIARRLQEARTRAGLTQTQLGERAGLKQSYIFEMEFGDTNPTIRTLEKITKALNMDLRDLLPGPPGAPPSESDVKHIKTNLERLTRDVEEYFTNERQRNEREEQRRTKQEVALVNTIRALTELTDNLRPLSKPREESNREEDK